MHISVVRILWAILDKVAYWYNISCLGYFRDQTWKSLLIYVVKLPCYLPGL